MAWLPNRMQGATNPAFSLTWEDGSGNALTLSGTLSGYIKNLSTGAASAIGGTLSITNSTTGVFSWAPNSTDVGTAGEFSIYFVMTTAGEPYKSLPVGLSIITAAT